MPFLPYARRLVALLSCALPFQGPLTAGAQSSAHTPADHGNGALRIFFIDVEGGQATLFVSPSGESLLVDTGWPGNNGRDADRIVATARKAGLSKLDFVLLTHFHEDHAGGVPQLVARMPVGTFLDHGPNRELDHGITERDYSEYQKVLAQGKVKHLVPKPGDRLPIHGFDVQVISADGVVLQHPLPGAGAPNPFCKTSETRPADQTENSRSLGVQVSFGKLKILDLGDLTWDKEMQLMCPNNRLGNEDILIVSHHGWNQSSSPALVEAIRPRVAIMDNGENKGGSLGTFETLSHSEGLETLWQVHFSKEAAGRNTPAEYIANLQGTDPGYGLELTAHPDGSFAVTNARTHASKAYAAR